MTTNCYRSDVYRFNIDSTNNTYEFEISNVISWELMNIKMTKEELKGLADFINQYIERN